MTEQATRDNQEPLESPESLLPDKSEQEQRYWFLFLWGGLGVTNYVDVFSQVSNDAWRGLLW